ncbi:MAG: Mut7-C RNAse domain-containing protein [Limisphaera sp.]
MRRIQKACQQRFEQLAQRFGARRPEQAVALWMQKAREISENHGVPLAEALVWVDARLQGKWRRFQWRRQGRPPSAASGRALFCDAGLGGLARWLWAAGQPAVWCRDADDSQLVRRALQAGAVLLTTDSLLLERRVVRSGRLPTVWVPPTLRVTEQLALVFDQLGLQLLPPRCMRCGGRLCPVEKAAVADRIPPRTARWLEEFFLCQSCGGLFWKGTHWQRILSRLRALGLPGAPG